MIKIEKLSKSYGTNEVLKQIDLSIEKSKVYGFVGENGSGKTTLFKCISGLESFKGNIISTYQPLKNHIGFLQTAPYFFPKITGREYLQLLCNARNIKNVDFDIQNVFNLPLNNYAVTYSTGMKKKLAFLSILLQNNDILILDEPFNGVDIHSNIIIKEIIQKLKLLNKTILISSHIFSTLNDTCDEINLLKDGHFIKKVNKESFGELEKEMIKFSIGDRLNRLNLK